MVERAAHDGFVVGSSPAKPIIRIITHIVVLEMDFNSKDYQNVKLKNFFKTNGFFLWFHSAKLDLNQWTHTEQNLKKLKLNYSKALNGITLKLFKESIYKNLSPIVCSFVLFINSSFKTTELQLNQTKKDLKPSFKLIAIKLNNKIYSKSQLKGINDFSYKKSVLNLYSSLDQHLKTSYVLTKKKVVSK